MRLVLKVVLAGGRTERLEATGPVLTTGRDPDCSLALPEDEVTEYASAVHAEFRHEQNQLFLNDLGSSNGTTLNGAPVTQSVATQIGDQIQLGGSGPVLVIEAFSPLDSVGVGEFTENAHSMAILLERYPLPIAATVVGLAAVVCVFAWPDSPPSPDVVNTGSGTGTTEQPSESNVENTETPASVTISFEPDHAHVVELGTVVVRPLANDLPDGATADRLTLGVVQPAAQGAVARVLADRQSFEYVAPPGFRGTDSVEYSVKVDGNEVDGSGRVNVTVKLLPRSRVVWLGFEFEGNVFAEGSGWLSSGQQVVTSGRLAAHLREHAAHRESGEPNEPVFKIVAGDEVTRYPVREIRTHPRFESAERGSPEWLQHDVGVLELSAPVENVGSELLTLPGTPSISNSVQLKLIGFQNPLDQDEPYDSLKVRIVEQSGQLTSAVAGSAKAAPLYRFDSESRRGLDGAIVVDEESDILGVAGLIGEKFHLVPLQNLQSILE